MSYELVDFIFIGRFCEGHISGFVRYVSVGSVRSVLGSISSVLADVLK